MASNNLAIVGVVIVVLVVIAAVFLFYIPKASTSVTTPSTVPATTSVSSYSGQQQYANQPVMITDPAQVPVGTSALVFTYTAVQVNDTTASGSQWVNATGSGSVNLVAIQNKTQVMAYANLPVNSTVSAFRLNITTVKITVNGTTYSVPISKTQVTIAVSGNQRVNATSGLLVDYTPTVSPAFSQNASIFVRVPAAKAAVVGGINSTFATSVNATVPISASAVASIAAVTPNVQITNASIWASGNSTWVSVAVKNNGAKTVVLNTVNVYGAQDVNATASASANVSDQFATNLNAALTGGIVSTIFKGNPAFATLVSVGANLKSYQMQTFSAGSSGALAQVTSLSSVQSGVSVAPGATATLTFNGTASYNGGTYQTTPVNGAKYTVNLVGATGAFATTSVTAT